MDLRDYVRLARAHWVTIAALFIVGVIGSLSFSLLQQPEFSSTAQVFVSTNQATDVSDLNQGTTYTQQIVKSYARVLQTSIVLEPVIDELKLSLTPEQLAQKLTVDTPTDTVVLGISATDSSPRLSAQIANAVAEQLSKVVISLSPSADSSSPVKVTNIDSAPVPTSPVSPKPALNVALGALAGLVIGVLVVLLREVLDTRIRGERDIENLTDRPVLGGIMYDPNAKRRPLVVQDDPRSARAESFRTLRTNLQFLEFSGTSRAIVLTSSIESEGKTTTSANLAIALADAGNRVLLVEADLRRPKLGDYLGIDGSIGVTDVLIGSMTFAQASQTWGANSQLTVLLAGKLPPNPSELLQSRAMLALIDEARQHFDTIIFDAPPLLPVTDAAILARLTDGAIVVCAAGRAHKGHLRAAIASLEQVDANVLGIAATMLPSRGSDAYGYTRYGYGYGYQSSIEPTELATNVESGGPRAARDGHAADERGAGQVQWSDASGS